MITRSGLPALAACVAKPARRLCPLYISGCNPALKQAFFIIVAIELPVIGFSPMLLCLSIFRNTGPSNM